MDVAVIFALRGVAVGLALSLMLCVASLPRRARWALLPVLACLVAYLMRSAPSAGDWPLGILLPLSVGALLFPVAFWWLVHSAFDDRTDFPPLAWVAAAALVAAGLLSRPADGGSLAGSVPHLLQKAVAGGFVASAMWRLWRGRREDLVAGRRALRGWLLAYIGAHGLAVLGVESWLRGAAAPAWLDVVNVSLIGAALAVTLVLLVGYRADAVESLFGRPAISAVPVRLPKAPVVDPGAEDRWIERLEQLMVAEHAYRDPDLSLAGLAGRAGLPEYRLRELINRQLGFRNFPAYVNEHRLREVERRLVDPGFDRQPILTLALEAGFGSIGPFNRAFRERHGMTPTAFRAARGTPTPAV